jgi:hypothetical protein
MFLDSHEWASQILFVEQCLVKFYVAKAHNVPASCLDAPAEEFRDRSDSREHVDNLVDRFTETRSMTQKLVVCLVAESKQELQAFHDVDHWLDWLDANAELRDVPGSDLAEVAISNRHHMAYTCGGDHSRMAGTICQTRFPNVPQMWKCDPEIYAGLRSDGDYMRFLRLVGGIDNRKNMFKKKDYADKLRGARRCYLDQINDLSKPLSDQRGTKHFKDDFMFQYELLPGSAGLFMMVASHSERMYSLIEQIVSGRDINTTTHFGKSFKKPTGNRFFLSIPGVDADNVCFWLQQVIDGRRDLKGFLGMCNRARAHTRIKNSILKLLKVLRADDVGEYDEWEDVEDDWGHTCSSAFISRWLVTYTNLKVKDEDPKAFTKAVQKNIKMDLGEKDSVTDAKQVCL